MQIFLDLLLGGYPRNGHFFPESRSLSVFPVCVCAVFFLAFDSALPVRVGAVSPSLSSGMSAAFAIFATLPPLFGRPLHSTAAGDNAAQMISRSPSKGKRDGESGIALAFCVIVLDALV